MRYEDQWSNEPEDLAVWDAAGVGDEMVFGTGPCCGDEGPGGLVCTRSEGHGVQHVATGMGAVIAVWPVTG